MLKRDIQPDQVGISDETTQNSVLMWHKIVEIALHTIEEIQNRIVDHIQSENFDCLRNDFLRSTISDAIHLY